MNIGITDIEPMNSEPSFSKFLRERMAERKAKFLEHVNPAVLERLKDPSPITMEEYKNFRGNSYDRKVLLTKYSDEVLLHLIQYSLDQAGYRELFEYELADHYGHAVTGELVPELLKRLKGKMSEEKEDRYIVTRRIENGAIIETTYDRVFSNNKTVRIWPDGKREPLVDRG